jgi:hypothetical protein
VRPTTLARVRIRFARAERGESVVTVHRADGVVLELPSYTRKHRVPHDLAHAVAEREFGLACGVFGVIAAGAVFDNMRVVSGRIRHDAAARSRRILTAHSRTLSLAEVVAGALHHLVEHPGADADLGAVPIVRRAWGSISEDPFPYSSQQVVAAVGVLRAEADRWAALADDGVLDLRWPDALTAPVPPARTARGRR